MFWNDETENDRDDFDIPENFIESLDQGLSFPDMVPEVNVSRNLSKAPDDRFGIGGSPVEVVDPKVVFANALDILPSEPTIPPDMGHEFFDSRKVITHPVFEVRDLRVVTEAAKQIIFLQYSLLGTAFSASRDPE